MGQLEALTAELIADVRKWREGITAAEGQLQGFERKAKQSSDKIKKSVSSIDFGKVLKGISAAGIGFAALAKRAVSSLDAIAKNAKAAGIAGEAYQELSHAAQLAGLRQADFDRASQRLTVQIGRANAGAREQLDVFERLGVRLGSTEDVLGQLADKFAELDSDAERARIAAQLFGDEAGTRMVELLRQGRAELDKVRESARKLGLVYSGEQLKAAEALNDELTRQTQIIDHELNKGMLALAPILLDVAKGFATMAGAAAAAARELRVLLGLGNNADKAESLRGSLKTAEAEQAKITHELNRRASGKDPLLMRSRTSGASYQIHGIGAGREAIPTEDLERRSAALAKIIADTKAQIEALDPAKEGGSEPVKVNVSGLGGSLGRAGSDAEKQAEFRRELDRTIEQEDRLNAARSSGSAVVVNAVERQIAMENELARLKEQGATAEQLREREAQIRERDRMEQGRELDEIRKKRLEEQRKLEEQNLERIREVTRALGDTIQGMVEDSDKALERLKSNFLRTLAEIALQSMSGQGPKSGGGFLQALIAGTIGAPLPKGGAGGGGASVPDYGGGTPPFIPQMARGGSFRIGGAGPVDSKLIMFKGTPGELVNIDPGGRGGSGGPLSVRQSVHVMVEPNMRVERQQRRTADGEEQLKLFVRATLQDELVLRGQVPTAVASTLGRRPAPRRGIS